MKFVKAFSGLMLAAASSAVLAAGGSAIPLDSANIDPDNNASLQRGAALYVNYCLGCHSLKFQRYNRMGNDLGMDDDLVKENLAFTTDKVGETMTIAMPSRPAAKWFGQTPPDLSLIAREKGVDYLYTYLTTFYVDKSKGTGFNNYAFPSVGMPWVMWKMEGLKEPVYGERDKTVQSEDGSTRVVKEKYITGYNQLTEGDLSPEEFKGAMRDLTNFLHYVGEPGKKDRMSLGMKVIAYLLLLFVLAYFLKKEFWKDVH